MGKLYSWKDYEPKSSHTYLLDNSILLFLFAPIGNYKAEIQERISNFITKANSVSSSLATTSLVISEFYNVVFRDFFNDWKEDENNAVCQKDKNATQILKQCYRPTETYKSDIASINSAIKNIFRLLDKYNDNFSSINFDKILNSCNYIDFNDSYFVELANNNNWIICTRDTDIINCKNLNNSVISFL